MIRWHEPPPMDTGAPEPELFHIDGAVWCVYRARDTAFPGWGHPDTDSYLERRGGAEPFGALRFEGAVHVHLGAPSEDQQRTHPLTRGMDYYTFYQHAHDDGLTRWVGTFHDHTLDIIARTATASLLVFAPNARAALDLVRC